MAKKEITKKDLEQAEQKGAEAYERNVKYFSEKPQSIKQQALGSSLDECSKEFKDSYGEAINCNCGALKKDDPKKIDSFSCTQAKKIKERSK